MAEVAQPQATPAILANMGVSSSPEARFLLQGLPDDVIAQEYDTHDRYRDVSRGSRNSNSPCQVSRANFTLGCTVFRHLPDDALTQLLQVCRDWAELRHRNELWISLISLNLPKWSLPRRPRKAWHTIYFEKRKNDRKQWRYKHEILLLALSGKKTGKRQYGPLRTDSVGGMRKLLRQMGPDLDVSYVSDVSGNHIFNLAVKCGATR
eukprot:1191626-Prorocentrum_minimum.AAC.3